MLADGGYRGYLRQQSAMKLPGYATTEGTERYRKRFETSLAPEHFRQSQTLWISSIGLGTYLGNHDAETDRLYHQAVVQAVKSGCNVIDSAINYRFQRSERAVGSALQELASAGYKRDEIIVATKGGFIAYDGEPPKDARRYFEETFSKPGIAQLSDIVANCHCMSPRYLAHQLDRSLCNLDIECIDIYYLHNPETQLGKIPREEFNDRLLKAFAALEQAAAAGKIRAYGTATWNGYRNDVTAKDYLSLAEIVAMAEQAGGREHHFKAIQLPLNLGMTEALSLSNQELQGKTQTTLEVAQALGITVMCSASVLQGQLTHDLPGIIAETFQGLNTDGQRALQFVRSTPGVTTALVSMKQPAHVVENLQTAKLPPASWEQYSKLFQS
jgi:aryl-alcohol dehydrogenase-like predicted oxidoreductase